MTVYYSIVDSETIRINLRFESEDGAVGEGIVGLHSGEEFSWVTFEQLVAAGSGGEIEVPLKE